ncbi:VOC family protein [Actinomadura viridis]|uniref:Enzyme related to lactoylglutathione lyase n=1 Tax=Actinomadura viridis TaxID=58110 RepID=A0A931GIW3_9ACTN|nr:VOC family protein [Actinomadura viridis]MBG6088685.1 putative enzyme related to lactoylglutathione lyase [Actinomadura viridis]
MTGRRFRPGEAAWVELCTPDPEAAEEFYGALLGWSVRHERLGGSTYRMCTVGGRDVAGISDAALHGGRPRGWLTYFAVDDVGAAAREAVGLGGELVTAPRYLPAAGTGATVVDPYGAAFGLYQGEARAGVQLLNLPGALCWNELDTGEPEGSVAYYRSLFGYGTESRDDTPTGRPYTVLTLGDVPVAGVLELDSAWPNVVPSRWITYFAVTSLDTAVARAVELGGTATVGPVDGPHGPLHLVKDPGGHTVCLIRLEDGLRPDHVPSPPAVIR